MRRMGLAFLVAGMGASGCAGAARQAPVSPHYGAQGAAKETAADRARTDAAGRAGQEERETPVVGATPYTPGAGARAGATPEVRDYAQPPPSSLGPPELSLSRAVRGFADELLVAEAAVLAAGHDCSSACRALRSMQRSAARLCSIASSDEEREVCRRAQDRVRVARERVRTSCSQCTGGPALEPDAPIDSE